MVQRGLFWWQEVDPFITFFPQSDSLECRLCQNDLNGHYEHAIATDSHIWRFSYYWDGVGGPHSLRGHWNALWSDRSGCDYINALRAKAPRLS